MTVTVGGGVESISLVQNAQEHLPRAGPVAGRPRAIDLHPDARHRGERRRTLAGQPRGPGCVRLHLSAANRGSAAERAVRRGKSSRSPAPGRARTRTGPVHRHPAGRGPRTGPVHPRTRRGNRPSTTLAGLAGLKPVRRSRGARGGRRSSDGAGERPEPGDESVPAAVMLAAQGERYGNDAAPSLVLPEYARGIQKGAT
jgi:hypothetical protein